MGQRQVGFKSGLSVREVIKLSGWFKNTEKAPPTLPRELCSLSRAALVLFTDEDRLLHLIWVSELAVNPISEVQISPSSVSPLSRHTRRRYRIRLSFHSLVDMEGDEQKWQPFQSDSFPSLKVLHGDIRYTNKKRKFQDGQEGHPGRKPKFGELSCESEESVESSIALIEGGTADPTSSHSESFHNGNSFIEENSDDQPSTSSSEHTDAFVSNPSSLQSRTPKRNVEDASTFGTGTGSSKTQFSGNEMNYEDFMCSEYGFGDKEQISELTAEEMMIYSNDISPHLYVLSSGALGTHPEAQSVSPQPTIDQEFEQYFATLML
ncbi:uncharacterized protein [Aristolochia californica]|uniref:uncharacterized protein n=1 Tax=Aristolochia californica TaxID=171875 RepID=UPI0035E0C6D5